jgi:hypothetical protein
VTDLSFDVLGVTPERYAAAPTLVFRLRIAETSGEAVQAIALRCQLRIEPQRRGYAEDEREALLDLFGEPARWGETLKPFLWTHCTAMVGGFTGSTEVDLPVTCTYDVEVAGSKYLHGLADGAVPLLLLFNGTVFTRGAGGFQVTQIPWHSDASYRLPVTVWRQLMDLYFPNSGWLRLERDTIAALARYKSQRVLPTWEETFAELLKEAGAEGM